MVMANELEIGAEAAPRWDGESASIPLEPSSGLGSASWLDSVLPLKWPHWGEATGPSPVPHVHPRTSGEPADVDAPERLSMSGVLDAWRAADRALQALAEGSPEWAAVNATIISLRATYRSRFEQYTADHPDDHRP
jgi:hypothetical protein